MRSLRKRAGLSLVEIMIVLALFGVLALVSASGLKSGVEKGASVGLATQLSSELRAARQLAIARGYPVAVGLPRGSSEVANSLYRLEGWNVPRVTWSVNYSGDYPSMGFAAAGWSGASFTTAAPAAPLTKAAGFNLNTWIPTAYQSDSLLCFAPDGSVTSNGLPLLDNRYTIVVAQDPVVSGGTITAGSEPCAIFVSSNGAVTQSKVLPGANLTPGISGARSGVKGREELVGSAHIWLSEIKVRPEADGASVDAFCTPGEQVTFELYAYDPEGRQLFTQWKQQSPSGKLGNFGFPRSLQGNLTSEVERMEYVESPPSDINWMGADLPPSGVFRARWTWTVPQNSQPGERYEITADVQDATGQAVIENPPPGPISSTVLPTGRLLAEMRKTPTSPWQIVRMNRDGGGKEALTALGVEETMPSVDLSGTKLAFLQGPPGNVNQRCVKVRSLTGGGEFKIAGPGRYTAVSLSPNGAWISYRKDEASSPGAGTLYIQRIDQPASSAFSRNQTFYNESATEPPWDIEPERTGWTPDSQYALWGNCEGPSGPNQGVIQLGRLNGSGVTDMGTIYRCSNGQNLYSPTVFTPEPAEGPRLAFTVSTSNPVIAHLPFTPGDLGSGSADPATPGPNPCQKIDLAAADPNSTGSGDYNDTYPNISTDGRNIVLPRVHRPSGNTRSALVVGWNDTANNFITNVNDRNKIKGEIRSIVWLP